MPRDEKKKKKEKCIKKIQFTEYSMNVCDNMPYALDKVLTAVHHTLLHKIMLWIMKDYQ